MTSDPSTDVVKWGALEIAYSYSFSRRKTLSISVHPDLKVTVKAPYGTSLEKIRCYVKRRGAWIRRSWRDFEQYLPKQPPRRYIGGESHRYLGRQYRLKIELGEADSVKCLRGYMWVTTKAEATPEKIKKLLDDWYRSHAREVFRERLLACCQKVEKKGILLPALVIRRMSSRWGSLSLSGRLTLNLLLVAAPKECIDYVILHELCHFKFKHHGSGFWRLMALLMPDYKARRKKLNSCAD